MPSPIRHKKTGVYWLRIRVPADLRAAIGKTEIKRTLGTKDPEEAKARFPDALKAVQEDFARLRRGPAPLSPREISGLAGEHYRELVALGGRAEDAGAWTNFAQASEARVGNAPALARWWGPTAEALASKAGLLPDEHSRQRLAQALHDATLRASEVNRRAAAGDFSPDLNLARFAPMPVKATEAVTLGKLLELWEREHKVTGGAKKTRTDWSRIVALFKARLGHEDAERVSPKDVADFADHLRHDKGLTAKTINGRYLAALGSIYRVGMAKHIIGKNPVEGAGVAPERVTKLRPKGFTSDEAKAVLGAALREKDPARRWIPWIAAYTGCRVGEIAQLRRRDFGEDEGVPYFRVTPEAGSVKTGEARPVPLHPHLVELGLLDFVKKTKTEDGRIFTAKDAPRMATRFVRRTLGLPEGRGIMPNHAWRHRLKSLGRECGMNTAALDALQGHAPGTEGGRYGEWSVAALYRELIKLPRYAVGD